MSANTFRHQHFVDAESLPWTWNASLGKGGGGLQGGLGGLAKGCPKSVAW